MDFALLEKGIWLGCAGIGFAALFNVPRRTLGVIYIIAALGGLLKFYLISLEIGLVFAALVGAIPFGFFEFVFVQRSALRSHIKRKS